MNDRASERKKLEGLLQDAYAKGEFVLHYQPQVKVHSRLVTCVEALMRWQKPVDGLQLPWQFIPQAEETGLITALDEWALRSACLQNKAWQDAGHRPVCVTVNLSARHIRQPQIVETVTRVLNETGLGPSYLGLEISECLAVKDIDSLASILIKLEAIGVQIFIDDFGKESASISHLLKWPLRAVKIDKSYIDNLAADPDYGSVVRSLIDMAHHLDINVVAEGVETEGQLAFLQSAMCDEVQGYYFSRPLPAEEFVKFISR
ncbi:MAG: EAL domain-containing protein [Nitrospirae bacterium]|nr:EAL domain-containing protein [Nitrospirota bacterium]